MNLKLFKKDFPLVAILLVGMSVISLMIAVHRIQQVASALRSSDKLVEVYAEPPFKNVYDSDYDIRVPELTYAEPPSDRFDDGNDVKQFPESILIKREGNKIVEVPSKVRFGEYQYRTDYEQLNVPINDNRRTLTILNTYTPRILMLLFAALVAASGSFSLFYSYKKGYITSKNIRLIQASSIFASVVVISIFLSKYIYIHQIFGNPFGPAEPELGYPYGLLLKGVLIPSILALGVIAGLCHVVCDNMRETIVMREEIDGTI